MMVKAPAVHAPLLATNALFDIRFTFRRGQAIVEGDKIKRGTNPGDASDDVGPPKQQIDPIEEEIFHVSPTQIEKEAAASPLQLPFTTAGSLKGDYRKHQHQPQWVCADGSAAIQHELYTLLTKSEY